MNTLKLYLEMFRFVFELFFVAMTTRELTDYLARNHINPLPLTLVGIGLMLVLTFSLVVRLWELRRKLI